MRTLTPFRPLPWAVVVAGGLLVLVLAVLPPFVAPPLRAALTDGFHLFCHQLPERSFAVGGVPLALCHRCTGIVAGFLAGALLVPLLGPWRVRLERAERPVLAAAVALAGADWLLGVVGVWANTPASRFGTGLLVGVAAGYLIARAAAAPPAEGARPAKAQPTEAVPA